MTLASGSNWSAPYFHLKDAPGLPDDNQDCEHTGFGLACGVVP